MKNRSLLAGLLAGGLCAGSALGTERLFTYTYEPETMPQGAFEFEQWVTWRAGRNATVGQKDFNLWQFREEFEYGVTDNYTVSLYLNSQQTYFKTPGAGTTSDYRFTGVSLENKYLILNPAEHPVGLALYLEPTYDGENAELEQKIILGQRYGDWKWALNLTHATEWENNFNETEGEVEVSFGLTRNLNSRWSIGFEARDHNELPEYKEWENTAFYLGPVANYRLNRWWATLSVMPQLFGANFTGNVDGNQHLELEGHELLNIRLITGFSF
jgi:hypothetical protein